MGSERAMAEYMYTMIYLSVFEVGDWGELSVSPLRSVWNRARSFI